MDLIERLRVIGEERGADVFGVADAEDFLDEGYRGRRPQGIMPHCRSVVVVGTSLPRGCLETLPQGRAEYTNTLMAATATIRVAALAMAKALEREGYMATLVPTEGSEFGYWYVDREEMKGGVSIKYAAHLAGLGSFGTNHLLITDEHGPRVRLTALITDAPLEWKREQGPLISPHCRDCMRCVEVCPPGALHRDGRIEPGLCRDYMFNHLGGLRCGLCVKVCPL
ncbi:MAG: 4Fe-4S dicluster domain-containing protein [Methanomassiliicoccales archaeon]